MAMMLRRRGGKKEGKEKKNGDPSMKFLDDNQALTPKLIEINVIPSNNALQAPPSSLPQNGTTSIKRQLYENALSDKWDPSMFDKHADVARIPLTPNGDTALHVAVSAKSITFVKELVNSKHLTEEDLEVTNSDGDTAFSVAALSENSKVFMDAMVGKNKGLPWKKREHDQMLPVHLAALTGCHQNVKTLSSDEHLHKMDSKDVERLFFITINHRMYDVAANIFEKYHDKLAFALNDDPEKLTALHLLVRNPSQEDMKDDQNQEASKLNHKHQLVDKLWHYMRQTDYQQTLELITKPLTSTQNEENNKSKPKAMLFEAVQSGNVYAVKLFLSTNRELLWQKDDDGLNLLHLAALYRQIGIFDYLLQIGTSKLLIQAVDNGRNNVLHLAAHQFQESPSSIKASYTQMRKDLACFMEVKKRVPKELTTMRNSKGETPSDIFYANRQELLKDVKDEAKGVANSGMVVAALIAAVVFAAALTVPGDKSNRWFNVFFLTNAVALFASSASIIYFMAIFASSWSRENKFFVSSLPRLNIRCALILLCVSIIGMVLAFIAASFLIYDNMSKKYAYAVICFGLVPIGALLFLICSLFNVLYIASWSSL